MKIKKIALLLILVNTLITIQAQKKEVTLEDIWQSGIFRGESIYGVRSMNDGVNYTSKSNNEIVKYAYKNNKKIATILSGDAIKFNNKNIAIEEYAFSADEKKILISSETENIYRHSTIEKNYIYDIATKKVELLTANGGSSIRSTEIDEKKRFSLLQGENSKQRLATFSPSGNKVAFVKDNNLYIKDFTTFKVTQITTDGKKNEIINGASDWVYEEEFGFTKAFQWSPDGKKIAFYRFDETNVKEFSMDTYGELYPSQYVFKYPKAGEENSKVTIHIFDLETNQTTPVDLGEYEYIPRIKWTKEATILSVQRMNRHQNKLDLLLVDATKNEVKTILKEESETYIDISDNLTFLDNKTQFIWTSEQDGYNHIYLYDINGNLINQITKGKWDVTAYKGYDEKNQIIYYISAEASPMERDLYAIKIDGSDKKKISTRKGQNNVKFSKGFKYFINYHSDANTPSYITLHNAKGKEIKVLKSNEDLIKRMEEFSLSKQEFFEIKLPDSLTLNAWMIKPPDFNPAKKYPVLMYVYGGPGINTVHDKWGGSNYFWYQMLAAKGYIIISVDARGTGYRGREFKNCTYKQLGKYETIDQIASAKYLQTLPYVDKDRIGIWGWSYGGYMSSNCITQGNGVFKMAIAVAPVTNWRYYDSIYTERYMQTPQENEAGYDDNSPINHVDDLKGKYLLVHGMSDDNVHFQNAVEMSEALIRANKQFDIMYYPNRNHGIYGNNARLHLYTKMTDFILENL